MILKDNQGNDYKVQDLEEFKNHILNYHTRNGEADYSIHERMIVISLSLRLY